MYVGMYVQPRPRDGWGVTGVGLGWLRGWVTFDYSKNDVGLLSQRCDIVRRNVSVLTAALRYLDLWHLS